MPRPCQVSTTTNAISARPGSKTMYRPPTMTLRLASSARRQSRRDFEIDVHEEGALLVREVALHDEEATLERLCAGLSDRSAHVRFIRPPKRADFDRAAVAEELACGVVGGLGHRASCADNEVSASIGVPADQACACLRSLDLDQDYCV